MQEMYTAMDSLLKEQSFFWLHKAPKTFLPAVYMLLVVMEEGCKLLPWNNHTKVILTE